MAVGQTLSVGFIYLTKLLDRLLEQALGCLRQLATLTDNQGARMVGLLVGLQQIPLIETAGGLSKQKSPVANDSQTTKDLVLFSSSFMRPSGSSRWPAVSGSRDPVIAGSDSDRVHATDASPGALQKISSAAQKSSPALSSDPKNTATDRNISNIKNLEPTLKGIGRPEF